MKRRHRVGVVALLVGAFALAGVSTAYADAPYWVAGHQGPYIQHAGYRYYGNSSSVYVPVVGVTAVKTNSIYAYYDDNDYMETGVTWDPDWSYPRKFMAYERQNYTSGQWIGWYGDASPGSTYYFELNNVSMDGGSSDLWRANVGGCTVDKDQNFYKGTVMLAAERYNTNTSEYAKFNQMKFKDYNSSWLNWSASPDWSRSVSEQWYSGLYSGGYTQFESTQ